MPESSVAVVRDREGRVHYAARASNWLQTGLANGDLTEVGAAEEVEGAPTADAEAGDGDNTGKRRRGSSDRPRDTRRPDDDTERAGVVEPKLGRGEQRTG